MLFSPPHQAPSHLAMSTVVASTLVDASIERTFGVFTDLAKAEERIPEITSLEILSEGPFGEGTRWRETRVMFKKESTEEMWVTDFVPLKGYTVRAESHGMRYETHFDFASKDGKVQVTWTFHGTPLSLGAKIMAPIFGILMKKTMQKCMLSDLEALRDVAQSQAA